MYPHLNQQGYDHNKQHVVSYQQAQQPQQQIEQQCKVPVVPQNPSVPSIMDTVHEPLVNSQVNYDVNANNPKSTKFIKYGSILLFIATFFITAFLLSDIIVGTQYLTSYTIVPSITTTKSLLMVINLVLMIASGVLGIISTREGTCAKAKYSLLHIVCLSIGMIVFGSEMIIVIVSFFTTRYYFIGVANVFLPILISFIILSVCGLLCCCGCVISGYGRYRDISSHAKKVSI